MLARFNVLNNENDQALEGIDYPLLLNLEQIASVKSINIMYKGSIIKGYWIRMVSGKKYKATRVPEMIKDLLTTEEGLTDRDINGSQMTSGEYHLDISMQ